MPRIWAEWSQTYLGYPSPAELPQALYHDIVQRLKNAEAHRNIFEFLVYSLICHFPLPENFELICAGPPELRWFTQDFLWFRLFTCVDAPRASEEANSLKVLQDSLRDLGPAHFDPDGDRRLFYFQVLLLSLQFERAVAYLLAPGPAGESSPHIVEGQQLSLTPSRTYCPYP